MNVSVVFPSAVARFDLALCLSVNWGESREDEVDDGGWEEALVSRAALAMGIGTVETVFGIVRCEWYNTVMGLGIIYCLDAYTLLSRCMDGT